MKHYINNLKYMLSVDDKKYLINTIFSTRCTLIIKLSLSQINQSTDSIKMQMLNSKICFPVAC